MKKFLCFCLAAIMALSFAACKKEDNNTSSDLVASIEQTDNSQNSKQDEVSGTNNEPVEDENEEPDAVIILNDASTTIKGEGASYSNGVLTISDGGVYSLSGSLSDGYIFVNVSEEKKVKLLFDGVNIKSSSTAPVFVENSPKETKIVLKNGTQNVLEDANNRSADKESDDYANAALFSKDDLEICGSGALQIIGNFNKGINSKDDLQISGGEITVTAQKNAIQGKDGVEISGGVISAKAGKDGISTNNEDEGKGNISISGGSISIEADEDAIQADADISISGGSLNLVSGGGSSDDIKSAQPVRGFGFGSQSSQSSSESSTSAKGIKAGGSIAISGGKIEINSYDDALHADASLAISGGQMAISTNDDAIHSDVSIAISGGDIVASQCYEGLEAKDIAISGGNIEINSADDGINAASESAQSENPYSFGGKGKGGGSGDTSATLTISNGNLLINSTGDGIDVNGSITISGGKIVVFGPVSNGDTAYDYETSSTITGGTVLAVGSSGMVEGLGNEKASINANVSVQAGQTVVIKDSSGNVIESFETPKEISNILYYSSNIGDGESYSIETSDGAQLANVTASIQSSKNGGNGGFGGPGQNQGKPGKPGGPGETGEQGDEEYQNPGIFEQNYD